ncbi:hypothetical protein [Nocardia sp. GTS18]|uniref:hypothetical protein n=1 Tax=Nocardia sp. GTS18 TaxID=1778064 RepID=UPI0015EF1989|nr:hypothetical protein [Nocardia sp. GTS18]
MLQGASDVLGGIVGFWDLKVADEEYAGSDGSEVEGDGSGGDVAGDAGLAGDALQHDLGEATVQVHGYPGGLAKRSSVLHESAFRA